MAMRPCEKCLENNWTMETHREIFDEEGYYNKWTVATCMCGNEVDFAHSRQSLYKKNGEPRIPGYKKIV